MLNIQTILESYGVPAEIANRPEEEHFIVLGELPPLLLFYLGRAPSGHKIRLKIEKRSLRGSPVCISLDFIAGRIWLPFAFSRGRRREVRLDVTFSGNLYFVDFTKRARLADLVEEFDQEFESLGFLEALPGVSEAVEFRRRELEQRTPGNRLITFPLSEVQS